MAKVLAQPGFEYVAFELDGWYHVYAKVGGGLMRLTGTNGYQKSTQHELLLHDYPGIEVRAW